MKQLLIHVFQILMGVAAIFAAFQRGPILQRSGTAPFPNQRFARTAFFVVGVVLILGAIWSLFVMRHIGQ